MSREWGIFGLPKEGCRQTPPVTPELLPSQRLIRTGNFCFYRAGDASSLAGCFARDAADVPVRIECEQGLRLELEVLSHRPRKKEFRKEHSARDDRRRRLLSYRDTATPWPELTLPGSG